jgi:copper chaperone CopZ
MKTFTLALMVLAFSSAALACDGDEHAAATQSSHSSMKDAVYTSAAHADGEVTKTSTFKVGNVMCESCQKTISSKLQGIDGFRAVKFTRKKTTDGSFVVAEVTYVPGKKVTNDSIMQAINSTGEFTASVLQ